MFPSRQVLSYFILGLIVVFTILLQMEGLLPPPTTTTHSPLTNASVDLLEESDSLEDVATHLRLLNLSLSMLVSLAASILSFLLRFICSDKHHLRLGLLVKLFCIF